MKKNIVLLLSCMIVGCSFLENDPLKVLAHENAGNNIILPVGFKVKSDSSYALPFASLAIDASSLTRIMLPPV